jgi:hypothetical protein
MSEHRDTCEYENFRQYLRQLSLVMSMSYNDLRKDWLNVPPCTCHITRRIKP